ncbi:hypothetical protein FA13DRAFT_1787256 [Coprinellus micaceus]|uniref:F-box domain-containing protein n=1 Tax=Coprinellus micaceus TaxID=71717 RepID=A0A4Y7TSJ9_COPMI|nr:hypothetical protein FA13DRAFT_1787256 [Coprinellus micaceus]
MSSNIPPMANPSLPPKLHDTIVDTLDDGEDSSSQALQHMCAASKEFIPRARPIIFRDIRILSFKSLLQLALLLDSRLCTIPTTAKSIEIRFEHPFPGRRLPPGFTNEEVTSAFGTTFYHFQSVEVAISLNIPWTFGRNLDWYYIRPYTNLRKFVASGTFIWLSDFADFLHNVRTLECLLIDASFKCSNALSPETFGRNAEVYRVPLTLKELALSPESLPLVKVDGVHYHATYFDDIIPFLEMYGGKLRHLYAWFEETTTLTDSRPFEVFADALQRVGTCLEHLELLLPSSFDDDDTRSLLAMKLGWTKQSFGTYSHQCAMLGRIERCAKA